MKATGKVGTISIKEKKKAQKSASLKTSVKTPRKKNPKVLLKVSTTKDKLDSKLEKIAAFHSKGKFDEGSVSDLLPKSIVPTALSLKPKLAVALLSPYRFPMVIDSQKIAVGIARYGGVLFVLVGAFFTMFLASGVALKSDSQLALLQTTTTPMQGAGQLPALNTAIDCNDPLQYFSQTCSTVVDKTPDVAFDVQGNLNELKGSVRVRAEVMFAKRVKLELVSKDTGEKFALGAMTSAADKSWELYINTMEKKDGHYTLRAYVENPYGVYEVSYGTTLTFENVPLSQTERAALATTTATAEATDADAAATVVQEALLSLQSAGLDEFKFDIKTKAADSIKMYAYQKATGKNIFLGIAYKAADGLWKYRWNTKDFADGEYTLKAQGMNDGLTFTSNTLEVKKEPRETVAEKTSTSTLQTPVQDLKPEVSIDIQGNIPLKGSVGLKIDVQSASKVAVFAQKKGELIERFLGNAKSVDTDTWVFYVDTKNVPNGEYAFVAKVQNSYGEYSEKTQLVKVFNEVALPNEAEQKTIAVINEVEKEAVKQFPIGSQPAPTTPGAPEQLHIDEAQPDVRPEIKANFDDVKKSVDEELKLLSSAIRLGDQEKIARIRENIATKLADAPQGEEDNESVRELKKRTEDYVAEATAKVEEKVAFTNKLFTERTKEKIQLDSDKDGISDYDEVTLFKTNPYAGDTDNDGFVDSAEIQSGFDPLDARGEVLITHESPKEAGIERTDVFEVVSIVAVPKTEVTEDVAPAAVISGKAMPNSFVTLYVYSTPVVVTVKTEADGSWAYRFDKELEDGEHEVYVAVTDNAGKIVAKSKPFAFVKEAEAFSGVTNPNQAAAAPQAVVANT